MNITEAMTATKRVLNTLADDGQLESGDRKAVMVLKESGYAVWDSEAGAYRLTPKGVRFVRAGRSHGLI